MNQPTQPPAPTEATSSESTMRDMAISVTPELGETGEVLVGFAFYNAQYALKFRVPYEVAIKVARTILDGAVNAHRLAQQQVENASKPKLAVATKGDMNALVNRKGPRGIRRR